MDENPAGNCQHFTKVELHNSGYMLHQHLSFAFNVEIWTKTVHLYNRCFDITAKKFGIIS